MRANRTRSARLIGFVALGLAALFTMPTAVALHCNGTVSTIETPAVTFYIDDRSDKAGEVNHWVYMESNAIAGLQSGGIGESSPCHLDHQLFCFIDPCAHSDPDALII